MTFKAYETSGRGGRPRHLFQFSRQSTIWRFVEGDQDVTLGGVTYTAAQISRSEIKQTVEPAQDTITITMPYALDPDASNPPATQTLGDLWNPYVPSDTISVICMAYHASDPDEEVIVEWLGQVTQPKFSDGQLELVCTPESAIDRAKYQGPKWQVSCWKSVYSTGIRGCNLVADAVAIQAALTAITRATATAATWVPQDTTWVGGTAEWDDADSAHHTANITAWSGTTLTLDDVTGITVGTSVTAHSVSGAKTVTATPTATTAPAITAAAFVDQQRAYETAEWDDGDTHYNVDVTAQAYSVLTLAALPGLSTSASITALTAATVDAVGAVTAVSGSDVTAAEFATPELPFAGGSASWANGDDTVSATITAAAAGVLSLALDRGLDVDTQVTATTSALTRSGAIATIDGLDITVTGIGDGDLSLAGGYLWWTRDDGIIEKRSIMAQDGDTLSILYGGVDLDVGQTVQALPGCEHTWQACVARGNTLNYGGAIYKPISNPYAGRSMSWG